jgi:DNA-binding NarL/FixJ family response regulator
MGYWKWIDGCITFNVPPSTNKISILVVDDHTLIREGISALIGTQSDIMLAGEAVNGEEAIRQFRVLQPHITVIDLNLPVIDGLDVIRRLRREFPEARFVAMTAMDNFKYVRQALQSGVQAFLYKDMLRGELLSAIRLVHAGAQYIPAAITERIKQNDDD